MTYILTVLCALDQFVNALTGGYADETLSYRLAVANAEGQWFGCLFCRIADAISPGHCDLNLPSKGARLSRGGVIR